MPSLPSPLLYCSLLMCLGSSSRWTMFLGAPNAVTTSCLYRFRHIPRSVTVTKQPGRVQIPLWEPYLHGWVRNTRRPLCFIWMPHSLPPEARKPRYHNLFHPQELLCILTYLSLPRGSHGFSRVSVPLPYLLPQNEAGRQLLPVQCAQEAGHEQLR